MPCEFPMFQLSGLVSVDETSDPVLDATRARYKTLAPKQLFDHTDQARAVSQCMSSSGDANIVGHGKPGFICTGSGFFENSDPSQHIAVENIGDWSPSPLTSLTLLGCNVGKGTGGAELLFAIAQAAGATVRAPVGFVYIGSGCEDFYLDPGTGWQTATPDARPAPIDDFEPEQFKPPFLEVMWGPRLIRVDIPAVVSIALYEPGPLDVGSRPIARWDGADAAIPVSRIGFNEPFRRGAPAAIETGKLEVILQGATRERRFFRVYNDNRLQDLTYPEVFYRANVRALRV